MKTVSGTLDTPHKGIEVMFDLDGIYDGLVSGRLCGQPFDTKLAQLLLILLERLNWAPDARQLAGALPHFPESFGIDEFRATLAILGYLSTETKTPGHLLKNIRTEAVVIDNKGQLWLITKRKKKIVLVRPDDLEEDICRVRRNQIYRAIQFEPVDLSGGAKPQSWITETIYRFAPELRLLLVLTFLSGFAAILIAFGITTIFDTIIPTRNYHTLTGILVGLGLLFVFDFSFRNIRANIVGRVSGRLEFTLGGALLSKLLGLPTRMLTGVSLSDQLSRLKQFESIRDLFGGPVVLLMLELPLALFLLGVVAIIAWPIALLLAVYISVCTITAAFLAPAIRRETRKLGAAQSVLNRVILEIIEQREQIGRNGMAEIWIGKLETKLRDLRRNRRRMSSLSRWLDAISQASLPLAAATAIGTGAVLVINGALTGGALIAVTILTWRLFAPVQQGVLLLPKLQDVFHLFQQIDAMMRLPAEDSSGEISYHHQINGNLSARSLVLRYPKSISPVLMGVQFEIPHGRFVTLTGNSGSGKTTLLRVLAGQVEPQAGAVLFNNLNISQLSRGFRARNIAYVSQTPLFFYGSVAQFLRLADPTADDMRLRTVLDELGLDKWLEDLPNGLNTRLDPSTDGKLLSASVLTCLAVAQAFLTNPAVLLMDEPVGNMDATLEAYLIQALDKRRGKMTSVVVTHRPSLMKRSDAVIVLNAGTAVLHDPAQLARKAS